MGFYNTFYFLEVDNIILLKYRLKNVDSFKSYECLKLSIKSAPKYANGRTMNFGDYLNSAFSMLNFKNS